MPPDQSRSGPYLRSGHGVHPTVALEQYQPEKPLHHTQIGNIADIGSLYVWESFRRQLNLRSPRALPADLFLWALGEPSNPSATKLGGLPYWPRGTPWPKIAGRDATFLAQFNFQDSIDILPALPADVLLLFVADEFFFCDLPGSLIGIWQPKQIGALVRASDCPPPAWEFPVAHGVRWRTYDDPSLSRKAYLASHGASNQFWRLHTMQATKIGGFPYGAQAWTARIPWRRKFLCSLASVTPRQGGEWSWLNQQRPIPALSQDESQELILGDADGFNVFLDRKGGVHARGSLS